MAIAQGTSLSPSSIRAFSRLFTSTQAEDWTHESRFPASLKPLLRKVALKAAALNQYDEYFFGHMPVRPAPSPFFLCCV